MPVILSEFRTRIIWNVVTPSRAQLPPARASARIGLGVRWAAYRKGNYMSVETTKRRIKVLLIDQDESARQRLRRAFGVAASADFQFDVHEAGSAQEYHEFILRDHADVMVVDVRLQSAKAGTDDIVAFHHLHSPDTIIIAYSDFPGLDPVQTCVRAMRTGAVDCIEKRQEDSIRAVVERAVSELEHRISPDSGPSPEWLEAQLPSLVRQYAGRAVAVLGDQVVASASTVAELRQRLPQLHLSGTPFLMVVPRWEA